MSSNRGEPTFRIATASDAAQLIPLMREYYEFDHHPFDEKKAQAALMNLLQDSGLGRVWLICDGKTVAGYVVLTFGYSLEFLGKDAFVDEFFLFESHRRQGWGRKTLEFVEQAARELDIRALHLEVVRSNDAANQVYRKLGFKDRDHFLMSKWIDPNIQKPQH